MDVSIDMVDADDFDDLLEGVDLLKASSQESLTLAGADRSSGCLDSVVDRFPRMTPLNARERIVDAVDRDADFERSPGRARVPEKTGDAEELAASPMLPSLPSRQARSSIIAAIESLFERMTEALLNDKLEMSIEFKRMSKPVRPTSLEADCDRLSEHATRTSCVRFPGKSAEEAWRFTVMIRILEIIHEAIQTNTVISKRDIYYRDPALFNHQTHVDRYVDILALTLSVPRLSLNVTAVAKGLVTGCAIFHTRSGSTLNSVGDNKREGMLVPNLKDLLSVDVRSVKWILVIEKEATFRSIASTSFWDTVASEGVLVTGKGYPDIATRALLHYLTTSSPYNGFASPPAYALVDFDPDGLGIMSTYKHGSAALAHESAGMRVLGLKWLGLMSEHVMLVAGEDGNASQGLLMLSPRDREKARGLLGRSVTRLRDQERQEEVSSGGHDGVAEKIVRLGDKGCNEHVWDEAQLQRELQAMLILNIKAELQLLDTVPNGMTNLLASTLGKL